MSNDYIGMILTLENGITPEGHMGLKTGQRTVKTVAKYLRYGMACFGVVCMGQCFLYSSI